MQELGAAWALDKPIAVLLARPELRAPVDVSSDYIIPIERLEEPEVVRHIFDLSRSTPEAGPAASK